MQTKTINLMEKTQKDMYDFGFGSRFSDIIPKTIKRKKVDFIKIKNFCASKEIINKVKR